MCWIKTRQRFCTARRIRGYVVFFRGLIDTTECPEELATVFAHEIGHVEARDPTRIALRSAGSIDVLGLLFGGRGGALVLLLANGL
jgi:Zn-dependent protease with chaperone function